MANSTDEEKVATALAKEVEPEKAAEPTEEPEQSEPVANEPAEESKESQDKPESEEPEASTFTKPQGYEWVKGDNSEEFIQNLIVAYQNSTAEALRLRQAPAPAPAPAEAPAAAPATPIAPELAYAQSMMQKDQIDSFEKFAERFPQAREPEAFDQFSKALEGSSQAFLASNGRLPTYSELFERTAGFLQWSPSDKSARKDAAIKEASTSGNTQAPGSAPPKRAQVDSPDVAKTVAILRSRPEYATKSDSELLKELSEVNTS